MIVWKLRIEYESQLIEEINFDKAFNDYIIQDKMWRGEFDLKMCIFITSTNLGVDICSHIIII